MIEIIALYKRDKDGTEFLHIKDDGKEKLANEAAVWDCTIERLSQLRKINQNEAAVERVRAKLHKKYPHSNWGKVKQSN